MGGGGAAFSFMLNLLVISLVSYDSTCQPVSTGGTVNEPVRQSVKRLHVNIALTFNFTFDRCRLLLWSALYCWEHAWVPLKNAVCWRFKNVSTNFLHTTSHISAILFGKKKQKENKEKADQIVKILSIVKVSCVEAD